MRLRCTCAPDGGLTRGRVSSRGPRDSRSSSSRSSGSSRSSSSGRCSCGADCSGGGGGCGSGSGCARAQPLPQGDTQQVAQVGHGGAVAQTRHCRQQRCRLAGRVARQGGAEASCTVAAAVAAAVAVALASSSTGTAVEGSSGAWPTDAAARPGAGQHALPLPRPCLPALMPARARPGCSPARQRSLLCRLRRFQRRLPALDS